MTVSVSLGSVPRFNDDLSMSVPQVMDSYVNSMLQM